METPKTGIYNGIPDAEYRAWHGLTQSSMWHLRRSPAHFRHYLDNPDEPSTAMAFGSAMHERLFGSNFDGKYVSYAGTKRGKAWEEFQVLNAGKTVLSVDAFRQVDEMARAALDDPTFLRFWAIASDCEVSALWENGVLCKGRADMLLPGIETIVDYKTTTDAGRENFERSIFNNGYAIQAAHYLDGFNSEGLKYKHFVFAVQEKSPPYLMAFYRLEDEVIEIARKEIAVLKQKFSECATSNYWPGYPSAIQDIAIPRWAKKNWEEKVNDRNY